MRPRSRAARCARHLAGVGLALAALAAREAPGDEIELAPPVRVLLIESSGPLRLGEARVEASDDGLLVDGRPMGPSWRVNGDSPLRVGDLRVRGALEIHRAAEGGLWVVNHVPLEDYVASTVAREVYPDWEPELLKAQAVVTRTYALHQRARGERRPFDLRGGTRGQVYGGIDAETPAARAAAAATRGQYLAWEGEPILAVFHSASGGRTASAEEVWGSPLPYLVSRPVPNEEDSPDTYWRASVSGTTLGRALHIGPVREARVVERSASGRVLRLVLRGEDGSHEVRGRALRAALGESVVRSTLFEIRRAGDDFVLAGSGHGHGVGMSQWGARAMARAGAGYEEILAAFYPGTALRRAPR